MTGSDSPPSRRQRVRVRISNRAHFPRERARIGAKIWAGVIALSVLAGAAAGWTIGRAIIRAREIRKNRPASQASWTRPPAAAQFAGETAPPPSAVPAASIPAAAGASADSGS